MRKILVLFLALALLLSPIPCFANTAGPNLPTSVQFATSWTSSTGIEANTTFALFSVLANGNSTQIAGGTYGFSIPNGSTIKGIQISFVTLNNSGTGSLQTCQSQIVKGGAAGGTVHNGSGATYSGTPATENYGSTSDLWGLTWAASDINASNFGFEMDVCEVSGVAGQAGVRNFQITVTFTPPAGRTQGIITGKRETQTRSFAAPV